MTWDPWSKVEQRSLARYVTPDAVRVCHLVEGRDDLLNTPDGRRKLVRALYEALVARNNSYAPEKYDPLEERQQIRTPFEVLEAPREGTCLDLALLFCGLCMGFDLLPVLIVLDGHALAAVSLERGLREWQEFGRREVEDFELGLLDSPEPLRALIEQQRYLAVECTGFARSTKLRGATPEEQDRKDGILDFEKAKEVGLLQIEGTARAFQFALDIASLHYRWGLSPFTIPGYEERERKAPFMAPSAPQPFIDHDNLLREIKRQLLTGGNKPTVVLIQVPGVGKTGVAAMLANDRDVIKHFSDGVLWAGLGREPDVLALMAGWAKEVGIPADELTNLKRIEERSKAIHDKIGLNRMLLVVDDAWQIENALAFQVGGPNCAHVVTTRLAEVAAQFVGDGIHVVPEMNLDDGLALLAKLAPEAVKLEPVEARRLVREVGALPQALVIIGRHLSRASFGGQKHRTRTFLSKLRKAEERLKLELPQSPRETHPGLPPETPLSLTASIGISDRTLGKESRRVLRALSIFRPKPNTFSEEAALAVSGSTIDILGELLDTGLIEFDNDRYTLPRTVADYARVDLLTHESEEYHRRAIAHYSEQLREYEETRRDTSPYERMYSYEDSEWQAVKSEWLYHLVHTSDRVSANLAFTKAYFDAFWWWGCYRPFPFCERLLDEWGETQTDPEDQEWLRLLRGFHQSYPTGYEKRGKGDWQTVEEALIEIRKRGRLDGNIAHLDVERAHIRAVTDLFLAESYRYRQVDDPRADEYYNEALDLFKKAQTDDDDWNIPWTLCHQGELCLERGQYEKALQLCQESTTLAQEATDEKSEWDNEVIANNYRIQADAFWQQGDLKLAFRNYARAVFYAYVFQACPKPPDFYTLDFYREILNRTLARLHGLWENGQKAEALEACRYLRDFWEPYWEPTGNTTEAPAIESLLAEDRREELASALFPTPPTEAEIARKAPEYVRRVAEVSEKMVHKIDADD